MGLGSRVGDEAFYAAQAFSEADQFHILQYLEGCFMAVGIEGEHGAGAAGLLEVDISAGKIGKAGVEDFGDFRMVFQPVSQDVCIFLSGFHAEGQGFDAPGYEPAVPGSQAAAYGFVEEADFFCHFFIFRHYEACQCVVMACQVLGAAMDDDIGSEIYGVAEIGAHEGIICNEEGTVSMGDICCFPDIGNLHHGVGRGFDIDSLYRFIEGFFHLVFMGGIDEFELNAVLFVHETEETDGAAIEVIGRNDGIPRLEEFHDHGNGGHAGGIAGTVTAVLQSGYHFFSTLPGRILNPGIVIARGLPQLRMAEGGTLENGYGYAAGRILPIAAMNADCFDIHMKNLPEMMLK